MSEMHKKRWAEEEINYLIDNAGKLSLEIISKKLGRPLSSTLAKANEYGVGSGKNLSGLFTCSQFSKCLGVSRDCVLRWTTKGLKFKTKKYRTTFTYKMIDIYDFYVWGESHQDIIDTRKFKVINFGNEPEWLKLKRKSDAKKIPKKYLTKWTESDENMLISMYESGVSREEMAIKLSRSISGIDRKISRLKEIGYLPIESRGERYTPLEIDKLIKFYNQGYTKEKIALKIGRNNRSVYEKIRELKNKGQIE